MAKKKKIKSASESAPEQQLENQETEVENQEADKELYNERESVYEQFNKRLLPEDESNLDETDTSSDNEETDTLADNEETEASPDVEEFEKSEDKKEDQDVWPEGYVPYGALHEERKRRKSLQKEIADVKEQLHTVLQDYKSLNAKVDAADDISDFDVDDDDYVTGKTAKQIREENKVLNERLSTIENEFKQTKVQKEESRLNKLISETDQSLSKEGFVGFSSFGADLVAKEINKIAAEKGHEEAVVYQTPEGWKHLYKKIVYPQIKSFFSQQSKRETFENKVNTKRNANLIGSPGKAEKADKQNKEWTYEDYLEMRRIS